MAVTSTDLLITVPCPRSPQTLDVRLGFSLCPAEQEFLQKRKPVVAQALQEVLQLEADLPVDEVSKERSAGRASSPSEPSRPTHTAPCRPAPSPSLPHGGLATAFPGCPAEGCAGCDSVACRQGEGKVERERKEPPLLLPMHEQILS